MTPALFPLTKAYDPKDLAVLEPEVHRLCLTCEKASLDLQNPARLWEYGLALAAIHDWQGDTAARDLGEADLGTTVWDVGGGGSPFGQALAADHWSVVVIDPVREPHVGAYTSRIRWVQEPVEHCPHLPTPAIITCLSVLEHVPQPAVLLRKMVEALRPGGLLVLTVDGWGCEGPDTAPFHWDRQRMYNPKTWRELMRKLRGLGMERFGGVDWTYRGDWVERAYSFLSVVMRKPPVQVLTLPNAVRVAVEGEIALPARPQPRSWIDTPTCRVCEAPLEPRLDLGRLPINAFPLPGDPIPTAPLELGQCPSCALVQLTTQVDLDRLYRQYWYQSGINEYMIKILGQVVEVAAEELKGCCRPTNRDVWVDIGANDGTTLRLVGEHLAFKAIRRVAWDPATNLQEKLAAHADEVHHAYFPTEADHLKGRAKVVTSLAMFYDLPDPGTFCAAVKEILHPDGIWILQLQDLATMIETKAFDAICHEHLEYYTIASLVSLFSRHGLTITRIDPVVVNGGSLRIVVRHLRGGEGPLSLPAVWPWLAREQTLSLETSRDSVKTFRRFAQEIEAMRRQLRAIIQRTHDLIGPIDAYGASTKGNILLSYCGFGPEEIRQAIERSPAKFGRQTVTRIPIVSEQQAWADPAPLLVVNIWQFREAILQREAWYLAQGGKMLFPLPQAELVEGW